MPTTISQIQIVNMALARIGVKPITDLQALDDIPAEQARINWDLALGVLGRAHPWNCLLKPAQLQPAAQDPLSPPTPIPASTNWAPNTVYAVNAYVTFGDPAYLYQCLIANTSSASFTNDLTMGFWFQTDTINNDPFGDSLASQYPSGWAYKYPLPEDCLLVATLNDLNIGDIEEEYEIMGAALYTNYAQAVIKYTWANQDTTRYDTMFVECLVLKLAAMMATILRQDDTEIEAKMEGLYDVRLRRARAKDAGEKKPRRFNPVANSRWVDSRYFSTNN